MLKRKRSASELASSPDHNQIINVPPHASYNAPAPHLPSRTLKRFRDGRPSDDQVHQHTLGLLYSAQRRHQHDPSPAPQPSLTPDPSSTLRDQQTLHRFWTIHSAPTSAGSSPASDRPLPVEAPSSCQDCGAGLREEGGGDFMDLDDFPFHGANTACRACGKHVCFSCSVSNLGEDKRCLQCAGKRVWIGGIGWANNGVSVC
ncbi:ORF21 protein [Hirsutella rhossiliensis]|uniref:ORF21 protein n=1 Tax=Hirsutella rhossiliensis TaxID=111463 RepID=A0A9P8SHJ4_9HYPO|nr:ORF21 protein [Hirsutella rhossiliensis]KAH0962224.1 ORF21 protein [Hirsutella rhossiliensis]